MRSLNLLIRQMEENSESIQDNTVGSSQATLPPFTSIGDGVILVNVFRGDGLPQSLSYDEVVEAIVIENTESEEATFTLAADDKPTAIENPTLRYDWPAGSGASTAITSYVSASSANKITNGSFEAADKVEPALPAGWIQRVGAVTANYQLTEPAVNRIVISGTPTEFWYTISFLNSQAKVQTTVPIAFDASDIKTPLIALKGLELVTVVTTGTSPDLTHDVTMVGVPNPPSFTVINETDGTVTPSQTLPGSPQVVRKALALELIGTAVNTQLSSPVSLQPNTIYGLSAFLSVDVAPAAGVLSIELIDGSSGAIITDDELSDNALSVTLSGLTSTITQHTATFITPANLPPTVHISLRLSTQLSAGSSLFVDEMTLAEATELYVGGPSFVAFTGETFWEVKDGKKLSITNDLNDAQFHRWFQRVLAIQGRDVLFPVDASPTQADSKIA